jgi:hypothetical protein
VKLVRCIGAAGLIALALLAIPGRALATNEPTVTVNSPADASVQAAPFAITGTAHAEGNQGTITKLSVSLSSDDGYTSPPTQNYPPTGGIFSGGGSDVSFNWANNSPTYNGPYTVTVVSQGQYQSLGTRDTGLTTVRKTFHVEIPPAIPTGVSATKASDSAMVTVKWNKNTEPDIAGYAIVRSYAGAAGRTIAGVDASKTSYTDDLAGQAAGQYRYAVIAVRHARSCKSANDVDEACSRTIPGKQSAYSSSITVQGTAPTTTTTIKKSGGGGGSSGGGSNGGGTTTTVPGSTSGSSTGKNGAGYKTGTGGAGFPSGGEVDLSQFGKLLNPSARSTGSGHATEPDGTYGDTLPYGEKALAKPNDDKNLITIGGASIPKPSDDWVKFIGLGSFVTALLVHVLWFKQQVDRLPLETLN